MPSEPRWLTPDEIKELNEAIVEDTGEPFFVRDEGLLDSACARPQNAWAYGGVQNMVTLAMELLFGIAKNHPFGQGNKRTGLEAAVIFLDENGYRLIVEDSEYLAWMIVEVITGDIPQPRFEEWIASYIVPSEAE